MYSKACSGCESWIQAFERNAASEWNAFVRTALRLQPEKARAQLAHDIEAFARVMCLSFRLHSVHPIETTPWRKCKGTKRKEVMKAKDQSITEVLVIKAEAEVIKVKDKSIAVLREMLHLSISPPSVWWKRTNGYVDSWSGDPEKQSRKSYNIRMFE